MTWTYRIVKREESSVLGTEVTFGIHEAYDDGDVTKPHSITANSIGPQGETPDELRADYEQMKQAFEKPVLNYDDFERKV